MRHNFNIEINGLKLGVIANKSSYWGIYKMAPRPFKTETINPETELSYAYYTLTHNRKIQDDFLKGKPMRL